MTDSSETVGVFTTVHVVVPVTDANDFVEMLRCGVQYYNVLFAGQTPGISADALAAGADPLSVRSS